MTKKFECYDVVSFEEEFLKMIPGPIQALILLHPIEDDEGEVIVPEANRRAVQLAKDAPWFMWQG